MTSGREALLTHLQTGCTTTCRAWVVVRKDGVTYGFTDHDESFGFQGITFKANTGMTARALQQSTGLSVDNTETVGALSDAAVEEADVMAGRFDGAEVRAWLLNWSDPAQRIEQFRGNFGEITRSGGAFKAELRGLTDRLNQPRGKVFQHDCAALLGDSACRFDVAAAGFSGVGQVAGLDADGRFLLTGLWGFADGWFDRGQFEIRSGAAQGLRGLIKVDRIDASMRRVELWTQMTPGPVAGDAVYLTAGCDKRAATCRTKFANFLNFRGFPHIPGEDWLASYPVRSKANDGGSLGR